MEVIVSILSLAASWRIFQKIGRKGWEGIIPLYNSFVLFEELYGNGWKMLLMLIPVYNVFLIFKLNIDLAHRFHQGTGFGVGLTLLYPIFACILAFGKSVYGDGSRAEKGNDPISETIDSAASFVSETFAGKNRKDPDAMKKLEQLKSLRDNGILSEEEYERKRAELVDRI